MKVLKTAILLIAASVSFCGCDPDETYVLVKSSELKKAASGELATAKVEMVFDLQDNKDPSLPNKIRGVALPYLGEGAVIEFEKTEKRKVRSGGSIREEENEEEVDKRLDDAKIVARFNIPVGTEATLSSAPRSIMWLKYRECDKTFLLVNGNSVGSLNSALSDIDTAIEYEFKGGENASVTIKVIEDVPIPLGVAAVEVNGEKVIAGTVGAGRKSVKINYKNDFYEDRAPCFMIGGFQVMNTVRIE